MTVLLGSGCRETIESLPNVRSSSTTHNTDRATSLEGNSMCRVGKVQSIFISSQLKVIPLFCYSVFRILLTPTRELGYTDLKPKIKTYRRTGFNCENLIIANLRVCLEFANF